MSGCGCGRGGALTDCQFSAHLQGAVTASTQALIFCAVCDTCAFPAKVNVLIKNKVLTGVQFLLAGNFCPEEFGKKKKEKSWDLEGETTLNTQPAF